MNNETEYMGVKSYTFDNTVFLPSEGCWVIGESLHIYVRKRPTWFHKKMVKLMFGWIWKERHGIK